MIASVESILKEAISSLKPSRVADAMEYSLFGDGKRIRPQLLLHVLEGYEMESLEAHYCAAALECIHTYSLVHDDLPALDNDDLRRFKPTNHKVFGEDIAILAGDGLLTLAFSLLSENTSDMRYVQILSRNAGTLGMILGQELDILNKMDSLDDLRRCYELKTGCLFAAALEMGMIAACKFDNLKSAETLGKLLGVAFQFQDDLLEHTSSTEKLGKSNQSDLLRDKVTITSFMSLEDATQYVDNLFETIENLIESFNFKNETLLHFIRSISKRDI